MTLLLIPDPKPRSPREVAVGQRELPQFLLRKSFYPMTSGNLEQKPNLLLPLSSPHSFIGVFVRTPPKPPACKSPPQLRSVGPMTSDPLSLHCRIRNAVRDKVILGVTTTISVTTEIEEIDRNRSIQVCPAIHSIIF